MQYRQLPTPNVAAAVVRYGDGARNISSLQSD